MPFGRKSHRETGEQVDFDQISQTCIRPAVEAEGIICIREGQEVDDQESVVFDEANTQKPLFSRLIHSELVIADLWP